MHVTSIGEPKMGLYCQGSVTAGIAANDAFGNNAEVAAIEQTNLRLIAVPKPMVGSRTPNVGKSANSIWLRRGEGANVRDRMVMLPK